MRPIKPRDTYETRILAALAEGRITRAAFFRLLRRNRIKARRQVKAARMADRDKHRYARANRNARRWEQRHGLPTTTCAQGRLGQFLYWNFQRNDVHPWGRKLP